MISVRVLSDRSDIEQALPGCVKLAHESGSTLPFQYLQAPLLWWDLFNNLDGSSFHTKRGTNFLGAQSRLLDLRLLVAEEGQDLVGALPVVCYEATVPGEDRRLRIFTLPGDYQLISRYEYIAARGKRAEAVGLLIKTLAGFIGDGGDAVILPYLSEDSPNLPALRHALEVLSGKGFSCTMAKTGRRGGIRPWTCDAVLSCLRQIQDRDVPRIRKEAVKGLTDDLAACPAQHLLFPRTRRNYEERVRSVVESLSGIPEVSGMITTLGALLSDEESIYPMIRLPKDREAYMASLGKSSRKNSRNYRSRFIREGGSFEEIAPPDVTDRDIGDYLRLHGLRWGDASASLRGEVTEEFHRELCRRLSSAGWLSLFFARYEGKRVAVCSCIDILERREAYLSGRDPVYDEWGASRLVILETILDAIDKGLTLYDMGLGWFAYKMAYAKEYTTTWNAFITPRSRPLDLNRLYAGYECMLPA